MLLVFSKKQLKMKTYKIAKLPGDGIGPEIIAEGRKVIDAVSDKHNFSMDWKEYDNGAEKYLKTKELITEETLKEMKSPIVELSKKKVKKCPHCGTKQKELSFVKPTTFREGEIELSPEQVRQRLENVPDEDIKTMKIKGGRPEWLVITLLPVPPVTVRPSITLETGERSEDDLTHKLVDIIRINERLKKNLELGAPDFIIADIWELLQYHVSTYMDNEISTLPPARHRSGRSLRTLIQRLSKKDGRFRGNLSGKRVNFSARTVISPDPKISMNEVGIPQEIAVELTLPIHVSKKNKTDLKKLKISMMTKRLSTDSIFSVT